MSLLTGQTPGQPTAAPDAGNQTTDWRTSLPDDLRSEKVFESIKGKDWSEAGPVLAKNYVNAQRLVGADKLIIPTDKSSPEEIANFRAKLGVPAKFEDYAIKLPDGMADSAIDKTRVDSWRKEMHEAGIPKAQAERIMNKYIAEEFDGTQARQAARIKELETNELSLKQEFGTKFDEKINFARLAVKEFGSDAIGQLLESTGLGSNPDVVRLFANVGEKLADDVARGTGGAKFSSTSKEGAQAALTDFNRNEAKTKALFDKSNPQHDAVVKERAEMFAAAFPPESQ